MNRERLAIQVDILRHIEPETFDMSAWMRRRVHACRTTCCAFGYAALDERLQAEGLRMRLEFWDRPPIEVKSVAEFNKAIKGGWRYARPTFEGKADYAAAAAFYDISYADAAYLFGPEEYLDDEHEPKDASPDDVIAHIEELLSLDTEEKPVGFV